MIQDIGLQPGSASSPSSRGGPALLLGVPVGAGLVGLALAAVLELGFPPDHFLGRAPLVMIELFRRHDVVWLAAVLPLVAGLWVLAERGRSLPPLPAWCLGRWAMTALILGFAISATVGVEVIYRRFALTQDEFLPRFHAVAIARGQLFPRVPAGAEPWLPALQPLFMRYDGLGRFWLPGYRPGNAAFLAAFSALGVMPWAHVLTGSVALALGVRLTRRIWPDVPWAPLLAVLLLATSPQVWITSMTSYAMTPHLAFTLAWVLCFTRGDRLGYLGAALITPFAIGVHHVHIHPILVAPFLWWLVRDRRWALAGAWTAWYALWLLFWVGWQDVLLSCFPPVPGASTRASEAAFTLHRVGVLLLDNHSWWDLVFILVGLLKLIGWQNLAVGPLVAVGIHGLRSAPRAVRAGAVGCALLAVAHFILMPSQGHGWGYRYLHPALGFVALIAVHGSLRVARHWAPPAAATARRFLGGLLLVSLVALPLRAIQVRSFVLPFSAARDFVASQDADVVLVDDRKVWFGIDLARNHPLLEARPWVMSGAVASQRLPALCSRWRTVVIGAEELTALGLELKPGAEAVPPLEWFALRAGCRSSVPTPQQTP